MGGRRWTEEEVEYLKNNYAKMTCEKMANKLNRSIGSIYVKVRKLNLPRKKEIWTEDDDIYLEYFIFSKDGKLKEAAEFLNRSLDTTRSRAATIRKKRKDYYICRKWTTEEDNYIKTNYKSVTYQAIALRLGRSRMAVTMRVQRLGLRKIRSIAELDEKSELLERAKAKSP